MKKMMPSNIDNIYVSTFGKYLQLGRLVHMGDIADMICHIFQYYIQQQHDQNLQNLCWHYWVSTSDSNYSSV